MPKSQWNMNAAQWKSLAKALDSVERYRQTLTEFYSRCQNSDAKLDTKQIAKMCTARCDEVLKLDNLLEPRPAIPMMQLGPMALRACNWKAAHVDLCFAKAAGASSVQEASGLFEKQVTSGKQTTVHIKLLPASLQLPELSMTPETDNGKGLDATLSPISSVTLPLLNRIKAGIPLAATHFAFLFPVNDSRVQAAENSPSFRPEV